MTVQHQTVFEDDDSEIVRVPARSDEKGSAVYEVRGPWGKVICRVSTLEEAKKRLHAYMERVRKASGDSSEPDAS